MLACYADIGNVHDFAEVEDRLYRAQVPADVWDFYQRVLAATRLVRKLRELEKELKKQQQRRRSMFRGAQLLLAAVPGVPPERAPLDDCPAAPCSPLQVF
jgi:hypothetical protein